MAGRKRGEGDRPSLQASVEKGRRVEELVDRTMERARELIGVECDPSEALAAMARHLLLCRACEAAEGLSAEALAELSPERLARVVSTLDNSRISGERLRLQYERGFCAAREHICRAIEEELRERPELLMRLREVAAAAAEAAEAKGRGGG